jgi:pyruvate,water dikinase
VGTIPPLVAPLRDARTLGNQSVGGKAKKLSELIGFGYRVPRGFCITTEAYRRFVADGALNSRIEMELGRKALSSMRWEEIWEAALRIRAAFLQIPLPSDVAQAIVAGCRGLDQAATCRSFVGAGRGFRAAILVVNSPRDCHHE